MTKDELVVRVDIDDGFAVSDNLRAAFYALEPKEAANAQDKADD